MQKSKRQHLLSILLVTFSSLAADFSCASEPTQVTPAMPRKATVAMQEQLTAQLAAASNPATQNADITDLKFRDFFQMPIGPRGLQASEKLISLAGKQVRIVGYMVRQGTPTAGFFILAPLPVVLGDEDDSLSDDLPASAVFVHLAQSTSTNTNTSASAIPHYAGLLRLTGTLSLGPHEESDGHVSTFRLQLDPSFSQMMMAKPTGKQASSQH
jgi:hypothetical protein